MREMAASHARFVPQACTAQDAERRREQLEEFELLIEQMIEGMRRQSEELRKVTNERDQLREENERLRGG